METLKAKIAKKEARKKEIISLIAKCTIPARVNNIEAKAAIYSDTVVKIGSPLSIYSRKALQFIPPEFEDYVMERVINKKKGEVGYYEKMDEWYSNYEAVLDYSEQGKKLETVCEYVKINNDLDEENDSYVGVSISNLEAYCQIQLLKNHPRVAQSREIFESNPNIYLAYIEDIALEKKKLIETNNLKITANSKYLEVISGDVNKIRHILECGNEYINKKYTPDIRDLDDLKLLLNEFCEKNPQEFVKIVEDKNLELKSLIIKLKNKGILTKVGTAIFYEDDKIGDDFEQTVLVLSQPDKEQLLIRLKEKLKEASKK